MIEDIETTKIGKGVAVLLIIKVDRIKLHAMVNIFKEKWAQTFDSEMGPKNPY